MGKGGKLSWRTSQPRPHIQRSTARRKRRNVPGHVQWYQTSLWRKQTEAQAHHNGTSKRLPYVVTAQELLTLCFSRKRLKAYLIIAAPCHAMATRRRWCEPVKRVASPCENPASP